MNAVWSGPPEACRAAAGACWAVITDRYRLIFFGLYPYDEQWRSAPGCAAILLTVASCVPRFWTVLRLTALWIVGYSLFYVPMKGGIFDLPVVRERQWGGLALTLFVFASTVIIGMPMAVVLGLAAQVEIAPSLPRPRPCGLTASRSLPLLAIVFTCAIVLPLALPDFMMGDQLYRVVFGFAVFYSVYQAEIIRSGMKALAAGQEECRASAGS